MAKILKDPSRTRNVIKHCSTLHTIHEQGAERVPHWQWSALLIPLGRACFRDFSPWKASCGLISPLCARGENRFPSHTAKLHFLEEAQLHQSLLGRFSCKIWARKSPQRQWNTLSPRSIPLCSLEGQTHPTTTPPNSAFSAALNFFLALWPRQVPEGA